MRKPIYIAYEPEEAPWVFVGVKQTGLKKHAGGVYAFDPISYEVHEFYTSPMLKHPTGIGTRDGKLYVANQDLNSIHVFDLNTGEECDYLELNEVLKGDIEVIIISEH